MSDAQTYMIMGIYGVGILTVLLCVLYFLQYNDDPIWFKCAWITILVAYWFFAITTTVIHLF